MPAIVLTQDRGPQQKSISADCFGYGVGRRRTSYVVRRPLKTQKHRRSSVVGRRQKTNNTRRPTLPRSLQRVGILTLRTTHDVRRTTNFPTTDDRRPTTFKELANITNAVWSKFSNPPTSFCKAAALGWLRSISQEFPRNSCTAFRLHRGSVSN